jgi:hypothetical protein
MRPFRFLGILAALAAAIGTLSPEHAAAAHSRHHLRVEYHRVIAAGFAYLPVAHIARVPGVSPATIAGTAYYVSPSGSDSNSGLAPDQAWRTVSRVNRADLNP